MVEARYAHVLVFADLFVAKVYQMTSETIDNEEWVWIYFVPEEPMETHYQIKDQDYVTLPEVPTPVLKKKFPRSWFVQLNQNPGNERWFLFANYNEDYKSPSELFKIRDIQIELDSTKKENINLKTQIMRQGVENEKLSNKLEYAEDKTIKKFKEIIKAAGMAEAEKKEEPTPEY